MSGPNYGQKGRIFEKPGQKRPTGTSGSFSARADSAQLSADIEEFLPSLLADRVGIEIAQIGNRLSDSLAGGRDHGAGIAMCAARGLLQNRIDHAETQHVLCGD